MPEPILRYGQVWEDADVLADALAVRPGDRVLSIASAGGNALALLLEDPAEVVAVDLNPAQLAALALRVAAFRSLEHGEILELIGSRPSDRRAVLYARCRPALDAAARAFWDARPEAVATGIGSAGTFERYFGTFRRVLRLVHAPAAVDRLLCGDADPAARRAWYDAHWDSRRWRLLFRVMASRAVLGRARYPAAFGQVEGGVAGRLLRRVREAATATDPAENPYLQWVLAGEHRTAWPRYLRPEHAETIRQRLGRLSWRLGSLEDALAEGARFDRFNLSNVPEYLPPAAADALFAAVADAAAPGARAAAWNVLADRRPVASAGRVVRLDALSEALHARDRAPFYAGFHVYEVR